MHDSIEQQSYLFASWGPVECKTPGVNSTGGNQIAPSCEAPLRLLQNRKSRSGPHRYLHPQYHYPHYFSLRHKKRRKHKVNTWGEVIGHKIPKPQTDKQCSNTYSDFTRFELTFSVEKKLLGGTDSSIWAVNTLTSAIRWYCKDVPGDDVEDESLHSFKI